MPWAGIAMALPGGQSLFAQRGNRILLVLVEDHVRRAARVNGGPAPLSAAFSEILDALTVAVKASPMSADGHTDIPDVEELPSSAVVMDPVDAGEVAELLQLSVRQARRLIQAGEFGQVERRGRSSIVARTEVETYKEVRSDA